MARGSVVSSSIQLSAGKCQGEAEGYKELWSSMGMRCGALVVGVIGCTFDLHGVGAVAVGVTVGGCGGVATLVCF